MSYQYANERAFVFTDDGQRMLLKLRDRALKALSETGAFTAGSAMNWCGGGDSWHMIACIDRLVELGDVREIEQGDCIGQNRVFVRAQ